MQRLRRSLQHPGRSTSTLASALTCLFGCALNASCARADGQATGSPPDSEQARHEEHAAPGYWEGQPSRWFASGMVHVGAYSGARLSTGFGKPHWTWVGLQSQVATSSQFVAAEIALRADMLGINANIGLRRIWTYGHRRPLLKPTYEDSDLVDGSHPLSRYNSLFAGLWGFVPVGPTLAYWEASGLYVPGMGTGRALFSEFFRYTMDGSTAAMVRAVVWYKFLEDSLLIGPAFDSAFDGNRPAVIRLGGSAIYRLSAHLTIQALLTVPVSSPDNIGWFTQSWGAGQIAFTYATDEPAPGLL